MENINLFCLPFAGGSKYAYRVYEEQAPPGINIIAMDLPGRGMRISDPLLTNLNEITEDLFQHIRPQLSAPYAIYGHSMGTMVGYMLVRRIIDAGLPQPLHLFFTGGGGPSVREDDNPKHLMDKPTFIHAIKELGGMPDEILQNDEMLNFFVPILQADFEAVETHQYVNRPPFDIPIDIFIGTEEDISMEEALAWQKETSLPIEVQQLAGQHFFIYDHVPTILDHILKKLNKKILSHR